MRVEFILPMLLRTSLLAFGLWQDANLPVKYTDVDYLVFSDAASLVLNGRSPYERATYRYTPLLAWILTPNAIQPLFGKLLFIACDLLVGFFLYQLLQLRNTEPQIAATLVATCWSLNPFVATISTRGNSESVMAVLVLGMLVAFAMGKRRLGAAIFGLSVHLKIYPILHALPLWLSMKGSDKSASAQSSLRSFFSWARIEFGLISGGVFFTLGAVMYAM
ncbi:hypothetical protein HK101_000504 [Irineochytrium annulatum]|nr:hypothetical protein HK101_000504 [Irineochytrium annulatum]